MDNAIVGPGEKPLSSEAEVGAGVTVAVGATELGAPREIVGNPNGLTVKRLNENGAKGLNSRGRAWGDPGAPADCAAAPSIMASPSANPATKAKHLNIDVYSQSISDDARVSPRAAALVDPR